ncbi:MAG: hypothetical protein AB1668_02780 [Nanoarchaeota archaeon]
MAKISGEEDTEMEDKSRTPSYERTVGCIDRCSRHLLNCPTDCRIRYLRAKSYESLGLYDLALADYRRIQQIDGAFRKVGKKVEKLEARVAKMEEFAAAAESKRRERDEISRHVSN